MVKLPGILNKSFSLYDMRLYLKLAFASFFMFVLPFSLAIYLIFFILPGRYAAISNYYLYYVVFLMAVSGTLGYFIIRSTFKNLLLFIISAKNLAAGKIEKVVNLAHQDELKDLALVFNKITSNLDRKIKELEYSHLMTRELFEKIGHVITSSQKMEALLALIVQSLRKVLKADSGFIALYNNKDGHLYLRAYSGSQKGLAENMRLPDDKGVIGYVIKNSKAMVIKKAGNQKNTNSCDDMIHYNNIVCVPIIEKEKKMGVMGVIDQRDEEKVNAEDVFLLENLANQVASSIENFELNKNIEETYYETLLMLARVVEAKDAYSAGHLERVGAYVEKMADKLKLDDETRKTLLGGATLHDLGKVGIQENILKKDGTLTPEEYEIIKQHSIIGEKILKPLHSMAKLSKLVRHHHELYDGSGYPDGLKGEEIPLISRILTIVDIYDAISTDRPYRKALSYCDSVSMLRSYKGNKLDPNLVEVFIEVMEEMRNKK